MSGPVLYVMSSTIAKELSREQVCSDFGDEMIKAHNGVHFEMRFDGARLRLTDVSKFLKEHPEARTLMIRKLIKHYDELHKKVFAVFNITAWEVEADIHHESKLFNEIVNFKRQDLLNEYGDVKLVFRINDEDEEPWTVREFFESLEEESELVEPNILESLLRNPNHPALKDEDGMLLFEHSAEQTRAAAESNDDEEGEEGENEEDQDEMEEYENEEADEEEEEEEKEEEEDDDDEEEQAGPAQAPWRRTAGARGPTTSTVCFIPGCTTQTLRPNPRNTDIITHLVQAHGLPITRAMRGHGGNEFTKRMARNRIARPWLRQQGVDPNTVQPFADPTGETDEEDE